MLPQLILFQVVLRGLLILPAVLADWTVDIRVAMAGAVFSFTLI